MKTYSGDSSYEELILRTKSLLERDRTMLLLKHGRSQMTFLTTFSGELCVMKCYLNDVINNEAEVLTYFQTHSANKSWYPKLFHQNTEKTTVTFGNNTFISHKTLYYEYIPGITATEIDTNSFAKEHLVEHLKDLHSMGFVHGDIKRDNIVCGSDGRWYLIDYEHCYSPNGPFPHTRYNTSFTDDKEALDIVLNSLS